MTIKFRGRVYFAAKPDHPVEVGRRLGNASVPPCLEGGGDQASTESLRIFVVKGVPVRKAVYARPNVGMMRASR